MTALWARHTHGKQRREKRYPNFRTSDGRGYAAAVWRRATVTLLNQILKTRIPPSTEVGKTDRKRGCYGNAVWAVNRRTRRAARGLTVMATRCGVRRMTAARAATHSVMM